jgi:hypothetical protein
MRLEEARRQELSGDALIKSNDRLVELASKADRLQQALTMLATSTEELSALQDELGRLQDDRAKNMDLLTRFTFGGIEDRMGILGDIGGTVLAGRTGTLAGVPQGAWAGVLRMIEMFPTTQRDMFGMGPGGQVRTGEQLKQTLVADQMARILPPQLQHLFRGSITPSAEEDAIVSQMAAFDARQNQAQTELVNHLQRVRQDQITEQRRVNDEFLQNFRQTFFDVQIAGKEAEFDAAVAGRRRVEGAAGLGARFTGEFNRLVEAFDLAERFRITSPAGAAGVMETLASSRERFAQIRERRDLLDFTRGGLPIAIEAELDELFSNLRTSLANVSRDIGGGRHAVPPGKAAQEAIQLVLAESFLRPLLGDEKIVRQLQRGILSGVTRNIGGTRYRPARQELELDRLGDTRAFHRALVEGGAFKGLDDAAQSQLDDLVGKLAEVVFGRGVDLEKGRRAVLDLWASMDRASSSLSQSLKEFEALKEFGVNLKTSAKDLAEYTETIRKLTVELKGLKEARAAGPVLKEARGGSIFSPHGTDTVPAMLTPGEFVMRKAATQKYLPMLKSMNAMRFADGGKVPDPFEEYISSFYTGSGVIDPLEKTISDAYSGGGPDAKKPEDVDPLALDPKAPRSRGDRQGGIGGTGTGNVSFGGASVLTPQMLARMAYQRFLYYARSPRGRRKFRGYAEALGDSGDYEGAYRSYFPTAWNAAEAVHKAWRDDRFHPFGGQANTKQIEEKFGINARDLQGMRPPRGRFFDPAETDLQKAYNQLVATPIRYRMGTRFTSEELGAINAPFGGNQRAMRALMPPRFWKQWMRLRETSRGLEAYVPETYTPELSAIPRGEDPSKITPTEKKFAGIFDKEKRQERANKKRAEKGLPPLGDTGSPVAPSVGPPINFDEFLDEVERGVSEIMEPVPSSTYRGKPITTKDPFATPSYMGRPIKSRPEYSGLGPATKGFIRVPDGHGGFRELDRNSLEYKTYITNMRNRLKSPGFGIAEEPPIPRERSLDDPSFPTIHPRRAAPQVGRGDFRRRQPPTGVIPQADPIAQARARLEELKQQARAAGVPLTTKEAIQREKDVLRMMYNDLDKSPITGFHGYARGGYVKGPPGVDNIPALLSAGEYVVNKNTVQSFRKGGLVGGYADGGTVGVGFDAGIFAASMEQFDISTKTLSAASNTMLQAAEQMSNLSLPDTITLDATDFSSATDMLTAAASSLETSVAQIPQSIKVELEAQNPTTGGTGAGTATQIPVVDIDAFGVKVETFGAWTNVFVEGVGSFGGHINTMGEHIGRMAEAISSIPSSIQHEGTHNVNVNITGADILQEMQPGIRQMVIEEAGKLLEQNNQRTDDHGPGLSNIG